MAAHKTKSHEVTIRFTADRPITRWQAVYAVWNNVHKLDCYGDAELDGFEVAKITARKNR